MAGERKGTTVGLLTEGPVRGPLVSLSYYVVIRGPLGAGKTTIARALAESVGGEVLSIDPILERWEWDGGSEELFLKANAVAAEQAQKALTGGIPAIFDGNFYWRRVLHDLERRLPGPHIIFDLKVPLEVCIERDRRRDLSYGAEATREVFEKVAAFEYGRPVDGARPVEAVLQEMRSQLPAGERSGPR